MTSSWTMCKNRQWNQHPILFLVLPECSHACCEAGGWCGDPVFDDCSGHWDYGLRCSPSFYECCIPSNPATTAATTEYTGPTTEPTTRPPIVPGSRTLKMLRAYIFLEHRSCRV